MLTLNNVTLRYLEFDDIDTLYRWETDVELALWSGWTMPRSHAAFKHRYEQRITEPVKNLERVYAEVYGFNQRSLRLMKRVGFQKEGILRHHEIHNGVRQDMHFFGILKPEFYQKYETLFELPVDNVDKNTAEKMKRCNSTHSLCHAMNLIPAMSVSPLR